MKRLIAVLLILVFAAPVLAQGEKGLVGYWSFDEGQGQIVRDASGMNHHGRIKGGTKWVEGHHGGALWFNGTDAMVELANPEGLNLAGDTTFMAWVQTSSDDGRDRLIFGDTAGLAVDRNLSIELDRGALLIGHGNDSQYESFSASHKFDGTWQHLAIIFEQPRYYLYLNGRLHEVGELATPILQTRGGGRSIGGWWAGNFKGALDEVRLYNRALSEREIVAQVQSSVPPADQTARISLTPRLKLGTLAFSAMFTRLVVDNGRVECSLTRKGETQPCRVFSAPLRATRPESERAFAETTLSATDAERLPGGDCLLVVTARKADGSSLASVAKEVVISDRPAWLGSKAGLTEAVLPPYTPVQVTEEPGTVTLGVWGRSYRLGSHPLPEQITSREAALLDGPMRLRAVVDGKEASWSETAPTIHRRSPAQATLEQPFSAGSLTLQCLSTIEYDGLLKTECTLDSRVPAQVQSLVLEIPIKKEHARYLYTWPTAYGSGGVSGQLSRPMEFGFHPIVWIGDEARGLSWLCESEQDWAPGDAARAIQVVPGNEHVTLRICLIGKPTTLHSERLLRYSFAFQATPLRPMGKDGWQLRFSGCPWYGYDYDLLKNRPLLGKPALERMQELGIRTLIAGNWTPAMTYPWPLERAADFKALVKSCHAHGIRVIPYLGYQISEKAPEFPAVKDEVVVFPLSTNADKYPGMQSQMVSSVCLRSVWQDALVDNVSRMMDEFDIDGIYLDSTNMPFPCMNGLHGCEARRADGTKVPVYPVFAVRDTFRRLYAVVKGKKADGIVDSHVFDCMNSGALGFATSYWNGEQLTSARYPSDALPLDRFRTEFMGVNWGVPCELLAYQMGGFRNGLAVSLPHDVLVRNFSDDLLLSQSLWKLMDDFGRGEAQFTPYFSRECPPWDLPKDWIASVYRHPTHGALVILSNLSRQEGRAVLKPDWKALGVDGPGPVVDGLTRNAMPLKNGSLEIVLPAAGWKYVWLQRER
jgi:hypothetical protein